MSSRKEIEEVTGEAVRKYFEYHRSRKENQSTGYYERFRSKFECEAIQHTLNLLGIKIEGVNAE